MKSFRLSLISLLCGFTCGCVFILLLNSFLLNKEDKNVVNVNENELNYSADNTSDSSFYKNKTSINASTNADGKSEGKGDLLAIKEAKVKEIEKEIEKEIGAPLLSLYIASGRVTSRAIIDKYIATINTPDENGKTPLFYAAQVGDVSIFRYLLKSGADIYASYSYGDGEELDIINSVLRSNASDVTKSMMIEMLENKGLSLTASDIYFQDILENEHLSRKYLADLIEVTDPNNLITSYSENNINMTNLQFGIMKKLSDENIKKLLAKADSLNDANDQYNELHASVTNKNISSDTYLEMIHKGANVNSQIRKVKMTPLMFAINNGRKDLVKVLIENGADPSISDFRGRDAYDYISLNRKINRSKTPSEVFDQIDSILSGYKE